MAKLYGIHTTARNTAVNNPAAQLDGSVQGGRVRLYREVISLATQTTSDTIVIAYPKQNEIFLYGGHITTSAFGGTATVAYGITGTTGKYRAAALFNTADAYTLFGVAAAMGSTSTGAAKLTADEEVFITIAAANLPASGTYIVDLFFGQT